MLTIKNTDRFMLVTLRGADRGALQAYLATSKPPATSTVASATIATV